MINHRCSCACCSKCGGPTKGQETCPGCGKQFFVYRSGSYDWGPKLCVDCVEKNSVTEVIGHVDGLIKYNKPTGDKMKYGSDDFNKWIVEAKKYQSYCELAHGDPDTLAFAKALLAAQSEIDRLTKIKTPPGVPYDPEYSKTIITLDEQNADLQKKITALEACIVEKDKTLNKFAEADKCITGASGPSTGTISYWVKGPNAVMAEKAIALTPESVKLIVGAKEHVIEVAKWHIENWKPFLTTETLLAKALDELEALQRGEK